MPARRSSVLPRLGALVEGPGAYPHLSGRANLSLLDASGPQRLARGARRTRVDEVLSQVGLDPGDRRPVRTYSLGMRQRLGLAAALFRRPRLLILDEPTNGLDPQGISEIRQLLLQLNRSGTTVFLSSHLLAEIEQMCTRVAVLDRGRLVLQDDLGELLRPSPFVEVRTTDPARCVELLGSVAERVGDDTVLVRTADSAGLNAHLVGQGIAVVEIGRPRPRLEDVVLAATRA
jgi:ABC-2 type transport system ATP-binding protein